MVFAGTPEFALPALDALADAGYSIRAVYTQPDRPAGRGQALKPSPVKERALTLGIPVEQPLSLKDPETVIKFKSWAPEVLVVVAYGLILPRAILDVPAFGCLNIHGSILPRWRGAAPIQRAVLAGDSESGVAIMRMEAGLDTGPVFLERVIAIGARETAGDLHDRLATLGAEALIEVLGALPGIQPTPQPTEGVTYAHKIAKAEARIDWAKAAVVLDREIRAFNPWPISETVWDGTQLRIWQAALDPRAADAAPGTVVAVDAESFTVATSEGRLVLERVQLAGRKAMPAADFLRAHRLVPGTRLGGQS